MDELFARNWWVLALRGAAAILFAAICFLVPQTVLVALILLFAAYLACDGILAILAGLRQPGGGGLILEGALGLAAAAVLVLWPELPLYIFVYAAAAWAALSGLALLAAGRRHRQPPLLLAGGLSVLWGLAVAAWPMAGLVAWAWWIGLYALFFGVAMLSLASRRRRRWAA